MPEKTREASCNRKEVVLVKLAGTDKEKFAVKYGFYKPRRLNEFQVAVVPLARITTEITTKRKLPSMKRVQKGRGARMTNVPIRVRSELFKQLSAHLRELNEMHVHAKGAAPEIETTKLLVPFDEGHVALSVGKPAVTEEGNPEEPSYTRLVVSVLGKVSKELSGGKLVYDAESRYSPEAQHVLGAVLKHIKRFNQPPEVECFESLKQTPEK